MNCIIRSNNSAFRDRIIYLTVINTSTDISAMKHFFAPSCFSRVKGVAKNKNKYYVLVYHMLQVSNTAGFRKNYMGDEGWGVCAPAQLYVKQHLWSGALLPRSLACLLE